MDHEENLARFVNHYRCPECGEEWDDVWSCMCDDECPACGCRDISPLRSFDTEEQIEIS